MSEFRPGSFQILPTIIKNLIIINVLVLLAQLYLGDEMSTYLTNNFALHAWQSDLFQPWQFVTHLFMHGSWGHLFSNMFALWMFGSILENLWGPKRFITFYLVCGLGAALCHMIVLSFENKGLISDYNSLLAGGGDLRDRALQFISKYGNGYGGSPEQIFNYRVNEATLGASGAVFGCLAAFGYLFPNDYVYFSFLIPIKAKWFVLIYAGFELTQAVQNSAGDNVAHVAHLGGALFGILLVWFWNKSNKRNFY